MNASFNSELDLRAYSEGEWVLISPLRYTSSRAIVHIVPKGFITDLASIPRIMRGIIDRNDDSRKPAVLHDYLFCAQKTTRKQADDIFLEALEASGVGWIQRKVMYLAVRAGGWIYWNKRKNGMELDDFVGPGYFEE